MRKVRLRRPSPALVVSLVALIIAMGGTSYAAFKIGTKNIKNGAVTTKKLHNGAVTNSKLANGAVTGPKVNLGTLGTVPHASTADNANSLGGQNASTYQHAYALVSKGGSVSRSLNVTSVTHTTGSADYCVNLASSINASQRGATATPYYPSDTTDATNGEFAHVEFQGHCGSNGIEIFTFDFTDNSALSFTDEPFFISVP